MGKSIGMLGKLHKSGAGNRICLTHLYHEELRV